MLQHVGQLHLFRAKTPTETFHQASAGGLCFQMSLSVKNKRDRLFFTQLFVPQASQSSYDRRAELDVRLAIPSAQSACGMEDFMTIELIKRLLDACYEAKRIRDMLPPLPDGVTPSYIHFLDVIEQMEKNGTSVKVSDISDALNLPRPGVTRTVKEMEQKGYLTKKPSEEDARIMYLFITDEGKKLSAKYNQQVFNALLPDLEAISGEDAECTIRTIERFYRVMCERINDLDK